MKVITLQFNNFGENTYIVFDPAAKECAIIDPGMMDAHEQTVINKVIQERQLKPVHLINTHMHVDHVIGNAHIAATYGLGVEAHRDDQFLGDRVKEQARAFGMPVTPEEVPVATYLDQDDTIQIGEGRLKVLHVPGHSPGSVALYDAKDGFVITGDALFQDSIGRTDLPGGSLSQLQNAIRTQLMTLPDSTVVFPGHGPATTIGNERAYNPYL